MNTGPLPEQSLNVTGGISSKLGKLICNIWQNIHSCTFMIISFLRLSIKQTISHNNKFTIGMQWRRVAIGNGLEAPTLSQTATICISSPASSLRHICENRNQAISEQWKTCGSVCRLAGPLIHFIKTFLIFHPKIQVIHPHVPKCKWPVNTKGKFYVL